MKRKLLFGCGVVILLSLVLLITVRHYNRTNVVVNGKDNIYIMSTYDYKTTYSIYNTYNKSVKNVFFRENKNYSDFNIDEINNTIYYSELGDKKYDIYKAELSNESKKATSVLNANYSGDIFDVSDNKIIFRTPTKNRKSYTLGVYSLKDSTTELWNNKDDDVYIFNFYWDKYNHKIYTIERSINEMESGQIPTHKIFKYDEEGKNKQLLYSTDKSINNISVNNQGDKIIFDATTIENNMPTNKIYLLDLNDNSEQILIQPNDKFQDINISSVKYPKFLLSENGFYFLGTTPKSKIIQELEGSTPIMSNAIYYYDFDSKKISMIFGDTDFVINSFKIS
ncbi:hypothetical protein CBE01nite_34690 [Clostridium beijerinckii]|uniref:DUF5050 domain-containing protein n=1 Tax=Clostridium beijerinckii TaxID=1520 RepID=A0AB74VFF9_CLOBE|nr:hypothetical protein [Clostridium beijerinckii]NRZ24383.1 hypothetical protein [Clostridium beijerinckii]NYB99398.1 hypothetical protein [Clostridium beijerinckii]OOM21593.1 hypothetical protein CLBEI_37260 [Clostridium beijerinckii]QUN35216.1 hypothetical protein KEC93_25525 [Clostridium beijerinckii]SQB20296.1 Uncharacterised protein [Clostridium beijerinckii]